MSEGEDMKVAITGTIGGGKSQASKYLLEKGYPVFDSDKLVHTYYEQGGRLEDAVRRHFGNQVFNDENSIDRKKLAEIVFNNEQALTDLEQMVFPVVKNHMEELYNDKQGIVFFEVPLLFESGLETSFDAVIMVTADEIIRLKRLEKRGMSEEEVQKRSKRHLEEKRKLEKSDYIIYNNGSLEDLYQNIDAVLEKLEREAL